MLRIRLSILAGTTLLLLQLGTNARAQEMITIGVVTDHTGNAAEFASLLNRHFSL